MENRIRNEVPVPGAEDRDAQAGQPEESGAVPDGAGDGLGLAGQHDGPRDRCGLDGDSEGVSEDELEAARVRGVLELISDNPEIAIEQGFYLIRVGCAIPLNMAEMTLKRIKGMIISDELHKANEALKYLHTTMAQLEMAGRWLKDEARAAKKAVMEEARRLAEIVKKEKK